MSIIQIPQNSRFKEINETNETLVDKKFDDIYDKLNSKHSDGGAVTLKYKDAQGVDIFIMPFGVGGEYINGKEDIKSGGKGISITRNKSPDIRTSYNLIKYNNGSFSLRTTEMMGSNNQNIDNLDLSSVNKILGNFEKRIGEAENIDKINKYKKIEKANELAENEKLDIDNWLQQNLA